MVKHWFWSTEPGENIHEGLGKERRELCETSTLLQCPHHVPKDPLREHGADDAEGLGRRVEEAAGGPLGLRVRDLSGELEPQRQVTGHKEPGHQGQFFFNVHQVKYKMSDRKQF